MAAQPLSTLPNPVVRPRLPLETIPPPPLDKTAAYDRLSATSVGDQAVILERGQQKIVGRFIDLSEAHSKRIALSGFRTNAIVLRSKTRGVEVLGVGLTWEQALAKAGVRS